MIDQFDKNDVLRFCGRGGLKAIAKVAKARVPKKRAYAAKWNPSSYQRAQVKLGLYLFQQPAFIKANTKRQRELVRNELHLFQHPEFIEAGAGSVKMNWSEMSYISSSSR